MAVCEELAAVGITAHLAEPADTAFARGRKRRAKTDARHLRMLLAEGRLPECWIPPGHILECRALLETYHDLRAEHTDWAHVTGALRVRTPCSQSRPVIAACRAVPAPGPGEAHQRSAPGHANCRS